MICTLGLELTTDLSTGLALRAATAGCHAIRHLGFPHVGDPDKGGAMSIQLATKRSAGRPLRVVFLALLAVGLAGSPAAAADGIDGQADSVLRAMSAYMSGLTAFSVSTEIDNELVNLEGQKLQLSSSSTILLERPSRFRATRRGMFADAELVYDGETLALYGKRHQAFMLLPVSGTVDDAIRALEMETGLDAPGADLLFDDPYVILSTGVESSHYIGVAVVNGVKCHHLAFREEQVDWQLWVQLGDTPLPMKYVITSKWVTGAPQYTLRLDDWNLSPAIAADSFEFEPAAGAQKIDALEVNELGELRATEGGV
jgi:hypothetical protein